MQTFVNSFRNITLVANYSTDTVLIIYNANDYFKLRVSKSPPTFRQFSITTNSLKIEIYQSNLNLTATILLKVVFLNYPLFTTEIIK